MGSWNGTCFMSGVAIQWQEKVKLIFTWVPYWHNSVDNIEDYIQQTNGVCYPGSLWDLFSLPLDATYNDCGVVKDIVETSHTKKLLAYFHEKLEKGEIKIKDKHNCDWPKKDKDATLENFIKAIERHEIESKSRYSFILIQTDVWDAIMEKAYTVNDYFGDEKFADKCKGKEKKVVEKYGIYIKARDLLPEDKKHRYSDEYFHFKNDLDNYLRNSSNNSNVLFNEIIMYDNDLSVLPAITELLVFDFYVHWLRKTYSPGSGAGGQEDNIDEIIGQLTALKKALTKVKKDRKKRYDEF